MAIQLVSEAKEQHTSVIASVLNKAVEAGEVAARDLAFVKSLLKSYSGRGLSPKQDYWFRVMYQRVAKLEPKREEVRVDTDLSGIVFFMRVAQGNLKFPKMTFLMDGQVVRFQIAGQRAKFPGSINITDGGKFGQNKWYGRIHTDGRFEPSAQCSDVPGLVAFMEAVNTDPAGAIAAYGKKSAHCCFCNTYIETSESLAAGYGPVCAKNYGLPWGK